MTIGQILESIIGKSGLHYGAFGDCTAFQTKGSKIDTFSKLLVNAGFNSSGDQILYNGMTGEQLESSIFIGPTYYMRLKHMVKDKINFRARGPNTSLTRQPVQGRSNDGGLRIGEMERDGVMGHGMSYFLNESFLTRGDEYMMAVCNKTGLIAIYNEEKNLFMSPCADGPINFNINSDGTMNIKTLTRFGRSFSLLKIPYSFKLLIQELLVLNVQMRLITDENVDQLMNMSYSTNINKLLHDPAEDLSKVINKYVSMIKSSTSKNDEGVDEDYQPGEGWDDKAATPMSDVSPTSPEIPVESPEYPSVLPPTPASDSPEFQPPASDSPLYAPTSPEYAPTSPDYPPPAQNQSPLYQPTSPDYPPPATPEYQPTTPDYPPPATPEYQPTTPDYPPPPSDENKQLNALGNSMPTSETSVLDVQEEKPDVAKDDALESGSSSESKKIIIDIKQP